MPRSSSLVLVLAMSIAVLGLSSGLVDIFEFLRRKKSVDEL